MKPLSLLSTLAHLLLASPFASAALSYTVLSATIDNKQVDPSEIKLERVPLGVGPRNGSTGSNIPSAPPTSLTSSRREGHARRRADLDPRDGTHSTTSNWCGAEQHVPSAAGPVSWVHSIFSVPDLTHRPDYPRPQFAAAWVGIDGGRCRSALVQAGVSVQLYDDGYQFAWVWMQWWPDAAYNFVPFVVDPGNWLEINITAVNTTEAIIEVKNYNNGNVLLMTFKDGAPMCRAEGSWIMEAFYGSQGQVTLAKFSDVWFQQCEVRTQNGQSFGIDGAEIVYMEQPKPGTVQMENVCQAEEYDNANLRCYAV